MVKKLFLIPLMALVCSVAAWGTEIVVNDFASLKTALSASGTADVVKLGQDITYGSEVLNIERSLTLDGQGHEIIGSVTCELSISNDKTFVRNTIIAVNRGKVGSDLDVTVKNLFIQHSGNDRREICFAIFDDVARFALDAVETDGRTKGKDMQALLITGSDATPVQLDITNSKLSTANYPAYILKPITANMSNTTISGYCGLYFKYQWSSGSNGYGNTVGSRGSVITADACTFDCPNVTNGESNNFAIFPLEDDGITLNLNNCSFNASTLGKVGDAYQRFVNLQYWARGGEDGLATAQEVKVTVSGDNTHLYGVTYDKLVHNAWSMKQQSPSTSEGNNNTWVDINANNFIVEITGGTFSFDPSLVKWVLKSDNITRQNNYHGGSGRITINTEGYEIKEVSQGGNIVYRVVKKAAEKTPGVLYDLNDYVPVEGVDEGNNPVSSFELSDGAEDKTLNNEKTYAGYVEIKDHATEGKTVLTVDKTAGNKEQTLVINKGLDVQGNSQVIVKPGATVQIGEGGIVTEKPENIVIEANENGAASVLLDPTITVNQTPKLTVKMNVSKAGKDAWGDYWWHRFAMPVQSLDAAWTKSPNYGTYLYGWDYAENDWALVAGGSTGMVPWLGYTLTYNEPYDENEVVTYTFQGPLAGNIDAALVFNAEGFNFFGNSYTGFIDALTLVEGLTDNNVRGTIYMWNSTYQTYTAVSLNRLRQGNVQNYEKEVAPMQTFILQLAGASSSTQSVNYSDAVWGNPRYGNTPSGAPARRQLKSANADDAFFQIEVKAENNQGDFVSFTQNSSLSDAYDDGWDAIKFMNDRSINFYSTIGSDDYTEVATDNIVGKTLTLKTRSAINYTLSFAFVSGKRFAIKDNLTGDVTEISESNTYSFTAQPDATLTDRFEIVDIETVVTAVENVESKSSARGIYTVLGQYVGENSMWNTLPAGVYVVDGVKLVK